MIFKYNELNSYYLSSDLRDRPNILFRNKRGEKELGHSSVAVSEAYNHKLSLM